MRLNRYGREKEETSEEEAEREEERKRDAQREELLAQKGRERTEEADRLAKGKGAVGMLTGAGRGKSMGFDPARRYTAAEMQQQVDALKARDDSIRDAERLAAAAAKRQARAWTTQEDEVQL